MGTPKIVVQTMGGQTYEAFVSAVNENLGFFAKKRKGTPKRPVGTVDEERERLRNELVKRGFVRKEDLPADDAPEPYPAPPTQRSVERFAEVLGAFANALTATYTGVPGGDSLDPGVTISRLRKGGWYCSAVRWLSRGEKQVDAKAKGASPEEALWTCAQNWCSQLRHAGSNVPGHKERQKLDSLLRACFVEK